LHLILGVVQGHGCFKVQLVDNYLFTQKLEMIKVIFEHTCFYLFFMETRMTP